MKTLKHLMISLALIGGAAPASADRPHGHDRGRDYRDNRGGERRDWNSGNRRNDWGHRDWDRRDRNRSDRRYGSDYRYGWNSRPYYGGYGYYGGPTANQYGVILRDFRGYYCDTSLPGRIRYRNFTPIGNGNCLVY